MWTLFHRAHLAIMVPKSDGTPNSALEAMVARCPVVLGPLNYDSDLFSGTTHRLSAFNADELAQVITRAVKEPSTDLIERARKAVINNASLEQSVDQLSELYQTASSFA